MLGSCPICGRSSSSRSSLEAALTRFLTKRNGGHGFACEMWLGKACLMTGRSATGLLMEMLYNGLRRRADTGLASPGTMRVREFRASLTEIARRRGISSLWINVLCKPSIPGYDHFDCEVAGLRNLRHLHVRCCILGPNPGLPAAQHWHTTSLFIVWPEYHIHCLFSHTSNHPASNCLCHKTAQAEIPKDLPIFVWVQLREQPGRP